MRANLEMAPAGAEEQRLASEADRRNRLEIVGSLATGVAHDFNNMLTAILSYVDLQLQVTPEESPARRYALAIQGATERAADTSRQLLAFCRAEKMPRSAVDVNGIIEQSAPLLQRLLGDRIAIVLDLAPDVPAVWADAAQLHQVILNLAVNARDAMPNGGQLVFGTSSRVKEMGKREVAVLVHDTGSGISHEVLPHIFDSFFTTKPREKGTGVGLATVYRIVKESSGEILVNSEPNRGTTFEIIFPAYRAAEFSHDDSCQSKTVGR